MKKCTACHLEKDESEFYLRKRKDRSNTLLYTQCKNCMNEKARIKNKNPNSLAKARERQRKWAASNPEKAFITMQNARLAKYGIDLAKRSEMSINQDHKCKICGKPEDLQTKKMAVDHCHETGKVRGLLCDPCNRGLGLFYDNPETLLKAANYILNFQEIEDATPSGMPQQTV